MSELRSRNGTCLSGNAARPESSSFTLVCFCVCADMLCVSVYMCICVFSGYECMLSC
jgi:hypothetical protein